MTSLDSYSGQLTATCDASALSGAMCTLSPSNPIPVASGATVTLTASINIPNNAKPGEYDIKVNTQDTSGIPSHSIVIALTLGQDFIVTSSTPSQTVTAGQTSGPYNLAILPVGSSFTGAVTLSCSAGLPTGAQCSFSPAGAVTPGTSAVDVVMSISTTAMQKNQREPRRMAFLSPVWLLLPGIVLAGSSGIRRRKGILRFWLMGAVLLLLLLSLLSCAGISSVSSSGSSPGNPVTYQVTITGASPGTPPDAGQSTVVNLVVN